MKKVLFTILFCGSALLASAADVYVSSTGSDNNDGLSSASAFATLGKALTAVDDGGTIHVSGFLYACDDDANPLPEGDVNKSGYPIAKNVTIQGQDKTTDGFIGFSEVTYNTGRFFSVNNDGTLILKNLTLKDGIASNKGGAIQVNGGALRAENVLFEACEAEGTNQPAGGAIHVDKTTFTGFKSCLFIRNKAAKGGAFYVQDTQNPDVELRFEACSFVGNEATQGGASCGGLFFRLVSENVTVNIINSTFSGNRNSGNGGTIYVYGAQASDKFNIINTTVVGNIGRSGGGSGAGVNVEVQTDEVRKPVVRIQNSIIEGNTIADGVTAEDLVYGYEPSVEKLQVDNSFIGNVYVVGAGTIPADCYAETLYWNYLSRVFNRDELLSGIDAFNGDLYVYPLTEGAVALEYGNAAFLRDIDISTDQLGTTRTFAGGKCSVGAIEGVGLPGGAGLIAVRQPVGSVNVYQSGDHLFIRSSEAKAIGVELFSVGGQTVATTAGIGEVRIPVTGLNGIYAVKVTLPDGVITQKTLIK
jgi:predicted outer membrane repeat protein